jgi:cytochrome c oxidase subunit 4
MSSEHAVEEAHASVRTYTVVLAILGVVTAMEVGTYFVPWFQAHRKLLFTALSLMSIGKFGLVVGYFMHLRYDASYYFRVFLVPLCLGVAITVVVSTLTALRLV